MSRGTALNDASWFGALTALAFVLLIARLESRGWLITSAPPAPPISATKRNLKTGDVLLRIDGHDLAELGPLAVARLLDDMPFRTVPIELVHHGKTYDVQAFGEGAARRHL